MDDGWIRLNGQPKFCIRKIIVFSQGAEMQCNSFQGMYLYCNWIIDVFTKYVLLC